MAKPIPVRTDEVAREIVDGTFRVHKTLGPGLLESVYEACLAHELEKRSLRFQRQLAVPIFYDGVRLDGGLRLDLLVEDCVIVEVKATERSAPLFEAQLLTYLKLLQIRLGLLINFNVPKIANGISRLAL